MASCNYKFLYLLVFRFLSPIFNTYGYNNDRLYTFVNEKMPESKYQVIGLAGI